MRLASISVWALVFLAAACSSSGGGGAPTGAGPLADRLAECGIISGYISEHYFPWQYDKSVQCYGQCMASKSCDELWTYHRATECGTADDIAATVGGECATSCAVPCGDGETVTLDDACDGFVHCTNGADEADCGQFVCDNGETILSGLECDQDIDCSDRSDELGCIGAFECANGNVVFSRWCDGDDDCGDGSDEVDCPTFQCQSSGAVRLLDQRCDGFAHCLDGSDEWNCVIYASVECT